MMALAPSKTAMPQSASVNRQSRALTSEAASSASIERDPSPCHPLKPHASIGQPRRQVPRWRWVCQAIPTEKGFLPSFKDDVLDGQSAILQIDEEDRLSLVLRLKLHMTERRTNLQLLLYDYILSVLSRRNLDSVALASEVDSLLQGGIVPGKREEPSAMAAGLLPHRQARVLSVQRLAGTQLTLGIDDRVTQDLSSLNPPHTPKWRCSQSL